MDKARLLLAIAFCIFINVIIKVVIIWITSTIKSYFEKGSEPILKSLSAFVYPIFNLVFIFVMPTVFPALILEEYQYFLNVLFYGAFILSIYLWFFKPLMRKVGDIIKNYQLKNGGYHG